VKSQLLGKKVMFDGYRSSLQISRDAAVFPRVLRAVPLAINRINLNGATNKNEGRILTASGLRERKNRIAKVVNVNNECLAVIRGARLVSGEVKSLRH
jgi:hypothetical protein